jgi:osmotically inducible protein OsmC
LFDGPTTSTPLRAAHEDEMDRKAEATWNGDLKGGNGNIKLESGTMNAPYSFVSRFENGKETNPEELLGAALAGCFSMALAAGLGKAGHSPKSVHTVATVHLTKDDKGFSVSSIDLVTRGNVPGLSEADFVKFAEDTKNNCIMARAISAPKTVDAKLSA